MKHFVAWTLAAALIPLSGAVASEAEKAPREIGVESSIAFPGMGSIRNWEADGEDGLWVQAQRGDWYYGKLVGYCPNLEFTQTIGFDTRGSVRLDRFSQVIVDGERCALTSFVTSEKPLSRKERRAAAKG